MIVAVSLTFIAVFAAVLAVGYLLVADEGSR